MYRGEHELPEEIVEPDFRPTDDKGRIVDVDSMSDRELLVEMVKVTRVVTDKVGEFLDDLPNNPMFGMLGKFFR